MPITFRTVSESDFDALRPIEHAAHPYPWSDSTLRSCLTSPYWGEVLLIDDKAQGFFLFQQVLDEVSLVNICVSPESQGQGNGHQLLTRALELAKEKGGKYCFLEVRAGNVAALTLYDNHGFAETCRRTGYYPAGKRREDAVMMCCSL